MVKIINKGNLMTIEHISWAIHFSYGILFAFTLFFIIGEKKIKIVVCEKLPEGATRGQKIHYNKIQRRKKFRVDSFRFNEYRSVFEESAFRLDYVKCGNLINLVPKELVKDFVKAQQEDMKNV